MTRMIAPTALEFDERCPSLTTFSTRLRRRASNVPKASLASPYRAQILHPFAGSIQQYAEDISDPDRHRPDHCPQCAAQRPLTAHGFYSRTVVDVEFEGSIRVRRYLCHGCQRTVSLLPEFALP